jgi:Tol biopolymer transport system component/DNA-binding winged helix-turn-helix (wHTH) protein
MSSTGASIFSQPFLNAVMSKQGKHLYEFGPFRLDATNRLLLKDGELVPLKKKAVETLLALVERRGEVVSKDELIQTLWPDSFVEESNLSQYIYLLRKTLGEGEYINTISGRGYRFTAEARETYEPDEQVVLENHTVARLVITEEHTDEPVASNTVTEPVVVAGSKAKLLPAAVVRHKRAILFSVPIVAAILVGIGWWGKFGSRKPPAEPPRLVFATSFAGSETEPSFSPDGKQFAFIWNGGKGDNLDVYVKLLDVGTPLRLTTDPGRDRDPVWSPDGRFIAFLRGTDPAWNLILVPALGGPERNLGEVMAGLDWSPDGQTLVVTDEGAVTLLNIETGQRQKLTSPPKNILGDHRPVFSPDGQKVAFLRSDGGAENIFVVPVSGGVARQITFENNRIQSHCWHSDGTHLIYASNRTGGAFQLWKIAESGGAPEHITSAGNGPSDVVLARDGSRLAFAQTITDTNVWRLELPDGSASVPTGKDGRWTQFIASSRGDDSPQYSSDGQRIVFASHRSGNEEIWVCASDGSNARQVTQMRGPSTGSPRWSPDGREIAFDSRQPGQADIFVISAGGGQPRRLTTDPALDVVPSWSRDGQWIYFSSMRSGARQLWKVPAQGGAAVQVTQQGAFDSYESADGQYLYYTKSRETAGVWRLPLAGGAEEQVPGMDGIKEHRSWALGTQGLYFAQPSPEAALLRFYSFATGRITDLTKLEKKPVYGPPGLAVSPDGRAILYVQRDSVTSDIVMIENFR